MLSHQYFNLPVRDFIIVDREMYHLFSIKKGRITIFLLPCVSDYATSSPATFNLLATFSSSA